jgi:hypothetical protein
MLTDQCMQPGHPLQALDQASPSQPPDDLVDELNVVVILGPVIPNEQHLRPSRHSPPAHPQQRGGDTRRSNGQVLTATAGHVIPSAVTPPHDRRAHGLPPDLEDPMSGVLTRRPLPQPILPKHNRQSH